MGARQHTWRLQLFTFATLLCYHIYQFPNKHTLEAIQHWNQALICIWIVFPGTHWWIRQSLKRWLLEREFSNKILTLPKSEADFGNANNLKAPVTELALIVSELLVQIVITSCCVCVFLLLLKCPLCLQIKFHTFFEIYVYDLIRWWWNNKTGSYIAIY